MRYSLKYNRRSKWLTCRLLISYTSLLCHFFSFGQTGKLTINDSGYFETRGLNVFVFSNHYGLFGDEKSSGIEIIHHGVRTATNGDVRLNPTPEQWDSIPQFIKRTINKESNSIEAFLQYPVFDFAYSIKAQARENGIVISVYLDKPLPAALEGKAGFNLEFLPAAYFRKSYLADDKSGIFPLYPSSAMLVHAGITDPQPFAVAKKLVLAPEDPERRITIESPGNPLSMYDGRNKAQNGWFVVRSLLPAGKTGKVLEWFISGNTIPNWVRQPMIAHSQVGYHPEQKKMAIIELDKNDKALGSARLLRVNETGQWTEKLKAPITRWGNYLRYQYYTFDFSSVKENGIYILEYGKVQTQPFRIANDVFVNTWHPTLDVFFTEQMDHIFVNEAYRVWHGRSHMDDALQAPVNHTHFDLYAQGPTTGNRFKPGEHIPGLNIGGWYDAGDFDLRTQTIYGTVMNLVQTWELFKPMRDETLINEQTRYADMHHPDGKPDILQQIEHGILQLLGQQKSVGYAINGIVEAHLDQYTHLGDASTKTDNLVYNAALKENESDGFTSGTFDDRWAFTSKSSSLNYGSAAALAAASRALKGYNDTLATECLSMAKKVWEEENSHAPDMFRHGNTTGGNLLDEKLRAAVELLLSTGDKKYADTLYSRLPDIEKQPGRFAVIAVQAIPYMDASYKQRIEAAVKNYKANLDKMAQQNPFGVFIGTGGWAGSGQVIGFAGTNYLLYKAFPGIMSKEDVFRGLNYVYGCHPASDISLVSAAGTRSKEVAYGNNRADFTFIAGGIVPGVLIIPPDFPENKEDWPFLWGENEYVVNLGASYILLTLAVNDLLNVPNE
ncbi:MAG: glycoside hydrolase family 9 protein [Bacteroidota bacterium]|nr:glycoside hydrolase family 9 protein [Bacteroidota bacterium]